MIDEPPSSTFKELMSLSLPIMASNLLQTLYNMADAFFLGKLGTEAISAPSITMNVSNFIIVFGAAFTVAGTTLVSQAYGADKQNRGRLDFLASQVFLVNFLMSIAVMVVGALTTTSLVRLIKVPTGLTSVYTTQYMRITFYTIPFLFGDFIFRSVLQGIGDAMTPLYIQGFAVLLNIILDPLFIFGFGPIAPMAVRGAAWATFIARAISCTVSLGLLFGGYKGIRVTKKYLRPDKKTLKLMSRIGLPAAVGQSVSSLGFAAIQQVVNTFGPAVIAAFGIGNRIQSLFNMPAMGISQGTAVLVGRKLGAGQAKEAQKITNKALLISGIFITVGMAAVLVFGAHVIRFFVDDPEVVHYGIPMFAYTSLGVVVFALYTVVLGAFQGGGVTKPVMILNILRLWGLRVPLAYVLSHFWALGPSGIWLAMLISNLVSWLWATILYKKGKWKQVLINSE
ncbi:MAG: MATE family efflux transporter [Sphaerochaetaceae bacterium]